MKFGPRERQEREEEREGKDTELNRCNPFNAIGSCSHTKAVNWAQRLGSQMRSRFQ